MSAEIVDPTLESESTVDALIALLPKFNWLTDHEAARGMRVSHLQVRWIAKKGQLEGRGHGHKTIVTRESVINWIQENRA